MSSEFDDILGADMPPRFVIFSSYGNDSVALIQWAHEQGLKGVTVVYSDTGWASKLWRPRVLRLEAWARSLGFDTSRTRGLTFRELALKKKGFPTQQYQWCSYILKIAPGENWLERRDPDCRAVCLVGVRREEGPDRADFPQYMACSPSHGGRVMLAPLADWTETVRDEFLAHAGVKPLPHRSMECSPCVNSNRTDLRAMTEDDIVKGEELETELHNEHGLTPNGKRRTLFPPHRHMGAVGIREVMRWANSGRGKYRPPESDPEVYDEDAAAKEDAEAGFRGCPAGWCGS